MTRLKLAEPDLFATPPPLLEMPDAQRAMALSLIVTLLTEATLKPATANSSRIAKEVGHDKDHT